MNTLLLLHMSLLSSPPAHACGGFFCNNLNRVDQAGESIIFGVDEEAAQVTMHVQVAYEGEADEFSWVVPVRGVPEVFLSTSTLFAELPRMATPGYRTEIDNGVCSLREDSGWAPDYGSDSGWGLGDTGYTGGTYTGGSAGDDVEVLAEATVGAYETVTLAAEDADVLVAWLQDNGYDVPDTLSTALAPYLGAGLNLLALRLNKNGDAGYLSPLGLTYAGTRPAVPLTLTAVAAQPDMPLDVYVFGNSRAVPTSYLHVDLNPMAIDYWSGGDNLDDVIRRAADEAGGRAFATELVMPRGELDQFLWRRTMFDPEPLRTISDPERWIESLDVYGFEATNEVLQVLRTHLPVPRDLAHLETSVYDCPSCYGDPFAGIDFDPSAAVDDLITFEVEPREAAQDMLLDHSTLTRLRSAMSPDEMTVDPVFSIATSAPEFGDLSLLEVNRQCETSKMFANEAPQQLVYPFDVTITIPSDKELDTLGQTPFEYVQTLLDSTALLIEQFDDEGGSTTVVDNTFTAGSALPEPSSSRGGCGCTTSVSPLGGATGVMGLVLALAGLRRRRR